MKKLLPLVALALLVSCGSGNSDNGQAGGNYKLSQASEGCDGNYSSALEVEQSGNSVSVSSGTSGSAGTVEGSSVGSSDGQSSTSGSALNTSKNAASASDAPVSATSIDASGSVEADGGFVASGDNIECSGTLNDAGAAPSTIECSIPGSSCTLTYELVSSAPASSI